jgi:hypothetical protein
MGIRMTVVLLAMGLATQAYADSRGGVWFYQPDGGSYRVESRSYGYDPRSPYPQHRQYPQNLPPRYQGQLPQQYYDRHRGSGRSGWDTDRRAIDRLQRWDSRNPPRLDRDHRWHDSRRAERPRYERHGQDRYYRHDRYRR